MQFKILSKSRTLIIYARILFQEFSELTFFLFEEVGEDGGRDRLRHPAAVPDNVGGQRLEQDAVLVERVVLVRRAVLEHTGHEVP